MKNKFLSKVSGALSRAGFAIQKRSPEILIVSGVVGVVVGTVRACKATTKLGDILDRHKEKMNKVREVAADETLSEEYTETDKKVDTAIIYFQTGVEAAKLYAPAFIVTTLSITSILASHDILRKRNVSLLAAYATVDKGFKEYRERVVKRFGERVDTELRHGVKAVEVTETVTDEKTGEPKEVKKTVDVLDKDIPGSCSPYARVFNEDSKFWERNSEYNLALLISEQDYANQLLKARGYLFLNDVYDRLGFPRTKAGQTVGWVYDPKNPAHKGDNYVDFGIYSTYPSEDDAYECGPCEILLDFNVDGPIMDAVLGDI